DQSAAAADYLVSLLDGFWAANHFEGVVSANTSGDLLHRRDRVYLAGVDGVGRAELPGVGELVRENVDGDNLLGADERAALDRVESNPAAADHDHAFARLDLRRVDDRANASHHR